MEVVSLEATLLYSLCFWFNDLWISLLEVQEVMWKEKWREKWREEREKQKTHHEKRDEMKEFALLSSLYGHEHSSELFIPLSFDFHESILLINGVSFNLIVISQFILTLFVPNMRSIFLSHFCSPFNRNVLCINSLFHTSKSGWVTVNNIPLTSLINCKFQFVLSWKKE